MTTRYTTEETLETLIATFGSAKLVRCLNGRFELRGRRNIRVLALNDTRHLADITGNDAFAVR